MLLFSTVHAGVDTYPIPGGHKLKSPDYTVSVTSEGETKDSFVTYSYPHDHYLLFNEDSSVKKIRTTYHKGPLRHSSTNFSFDQSVTVRVTVKPGAKHITLPLKSAKVLPSSYDIPCRIINGNTIVFTLDRPEKVAVIANYDQVWEGFTDMAKTHEPLPSWDVNYTQALNKNPQHRAKYSDALAEGYDNPIIISALPKETDVPDAKNKKILTVHPGDTLTEEKMFDYDVVWFKPGIHDLSSMGHAPYFQTRIKRGQTVYLEGGSHLYARFKRYHDREAGPTTIMGRGTISGLMHTWIHSFSEASQLNDIDRVMGITITERSSFSIYNSRLIKDVTLLGAWHGNNDGPDYSDHTLIENCFLLAHDDNLKINDNTHAKHIVIWQGTNAHSIMVKETFRSTPKFSDSLVEDIDVITYFQDPSRRKKEWARHGMGAIACVTALPMGINNFTFRDIRIESPYLYRVFNITNLNTNAVNPGWFMTTDEERHTRINGMHFENITVTSPLLAYKSKIWSDYDDSLNDITFKNIVINGVKVTEKNKEKFFEVQKGKEKGLTFDP